MQDGWNQKRICDFSSDRLQHCPRPCTGLSGGYEIIDGWMTSAPSLLNLKRTDGVALKHTDIEYWEMVDCIWTIYKKHISFIPVCMSRREGSTKDYACWERFTEGPLGRRGETENTHRGDGEWVNKTEMETKRSGSAWPFNVSFHPPYPQ